MRDVGCQCKVTVDGTDCPIQEPSPFSPKWYSHKFKGPGLRYEVAVCIQTGWIVWVNGPYPCGSWPDLKIARHWLVHKLARGEKFLADGGYRDGGEFAETPTGLNTPDQRQKRLARARHETVNNRFKFFKVLTTPYRHDVHTHGQCFTAIANLTQIAIQKGEPLFQVRYNT
jgi:DDE superfamily endonuclease